MNLNKNNLQYLTVGYILFFIFISILFIKTENIYMEEDLEKFRKILIKNEKEICFGEVNRLLKLIKNRDEKLIKKKLTTKEREQYFIKLISEKGAGSDEKFKIFDLNYNIIWHNIPTLIGKNIKDINIETNKNIRNINIVNGDFLIYKTFDNKERMSYAKHCNRFNWIIITGYYIDKIEHLIVEKRVELQDRLIKKELFVLGIFLIALLFIFYISYFIIVKNKKHTEELDKQKELYNLIYNKAGNAILMIDKDTNKFINCNYEAVKMLKYNSIKELLNLHPSQLSPEYQPDGKKSENKANEMISKAIKNASNSFEWKHTRSNGENFWVDVVLTPIKIDNKDILHVIWKDIDNRKKTEEELEKLNKTLKSKVQKAIEKTKKQQEHLEQQNRLVQMGEMISMIAHQWRQPLNTISAASINLSLLSSMNMLEDPKIQKESKFIQKQCQQMSSTIETFMEFVKPSKNSTEFKITHVFNSIMSIISEQFKNRNINISIIEKKQNITIYGYENLLEQVVLNILSNARDALDELNIENKYINITLDIINEIPIITIEDNAGGIPNDISKKIFNPYFTTKEQGKGTGIGLYMSLDIMKKSFNGDLTYNPTIDGSCFNIICGILKEKEF